MSVASAIKAGDAFFEIFAEDKTKKGIDTAEQRLRRFSAYVGAAGTALTAFGAAAMTSFGVMLKSFAGAGDEISDAMSVTGLSSDLLQTLQFQAADAGVSFNALVGAITKMNSVISKSAAKGKDVIGLDAKQLLAMDPDKRFLALAEAISKIKNPADRAAAALAVFGKAGAKLLPALEGGARSLADAMDEMRASGTIMSEEDMRLAVETEGAFLGLGLRLTRIPQIIAASVAPAFLVLADALKWVLNQTIKFLDHNRGLTAALGITAAGVTVVGAALMALGAAGIAASFITAGFTATVAALGAVLAFVSSPAFVIAAAITACGVAAGVAAYGLDQAVNSGKGLSAISEWASGAAATIGMLQTAIVNGEWGLAGDYIFAALEHSFLSGVLALKEIWSGFNVWFTNSLIEMATMAGETIGLLSPEIGQSVRRVGDELKANVKQDAGARLEETRQAVDASDMRLQEIMDRILKLDEKPATKFAGLDFGSMATSASGSLQKVQTLGTVSSSGAARLANSAPGNQWQDKMLDNSDKTVDALEEIRDSIGELETLTVE